MQYVFLGTDNFSVRVLNQLKEADLLPSLIVTAPDRKSGRGQKLNHPPVKVWGDENNIEVLQPEKLDDGFINSLKENEWDIFILASYGKIIPQSVLDIPNKGTLNVHPSLLPKYRGATPIETAILNDDKETGVTIMLMDDKMDHGPILSQELVVFNEWNGNERDILADIGGRLLANTIPLWLAGNIEEQEQIHEAATFTKKIEKNDGEIKFEDIESKPREVFLKSVALSNTYFYTQKDGKNIRVKINKVEWDSKFKILSVTPEGKKEIPYQDFIDNYIKH